MISQQIGGSFGVTVGAVVLESVAASSHSLSGAFGQAFWWTTGFTVLAALVSLALPGRRVPGAGPAPVPAQPPARAGG